MPLISPISFTNEQKYFFKNFIMFSVFTFAILVNMCLIPSILSSKKDNIEAVIKIFGFSIEKNNKKVKFIKKLTINFF